MNNDTSIPEASNFNSPDRNNNHVLDTSLEEQHMWMPVDNKTTNSLSVQVVTFTYSIFSLLSCAQLITSKGGE